MSQFDRVKPKTYVPLRLRTNEMSHFFNQLRDRKLTRLDAAEPLRVSNKPLEEKTLPREEIKNNSPSPSTSSKSKSVRKRKPNAGTKSTKKKLENKIKKAKI